MPDADRQPLPRDPGSLIGFWINKSGLVRVRDVTP